MNANGTAQDLPSLAGFEDDDAADFASLLGARPRARAKQTEEVAEAAAPAAQQPDPAAEQETPAVEAVTAAKRRSVQSKPKGTKSAGAKQAPAKATQAAATPAADEDENKILPSSVHIPTELIASVIEYRDAHDMSNGQVLITAIEFSYAKLRELIHPGSTGGGLFQQRATKGSRNNEGPVSPLNIRLYKADYTVIDNLVAEVGAFSRGHLATVSLRHFFDSQKNQKKK